MNRTLYAAGWSYVAICGLVLANARSGPAPAARSHPAPAPFAGRAGEWFAQVKPSCNSVEVDVVQRQIPPPTGTEGAGYSAACYALAGKIERAREIIEGLDRSDRAQAANIVFNIGHPVADAGDDQAAGPIMRLVVDYTPGNFMAVYHAGISEYMLGQYDLARTHLEQFLKMYQPEDGWRANARKVLGEIAAPSPQ
jgi:tetratricopeptide (TPR) repeat protein